MKNFLENLIKLIVTKTEAVKVEEFKEGKTKVFRITVAKEDIGKIIGKNGKIIKAIRTLFHIRAIKENIIAKIEHIKEE